MSSDTSQRVAQRRLAPAAARPPRRGASVGNGGAQNKPGNRTAVNRAAADAPFASIDYGVLVGLVGFWIRRANVYALRSFGQYLGDLDLRPVEVATLIILGSNTGLSQIALAAALGTDQSTLVGLLARLEQRKLIERKRQPSDRRFHDVRLTRAGQAMARKSEKRLAEHNAALLLPLSAAERDLLISLLRRVLGSTD